MSLARIGALADGVFAIVMTLLVFEMQIPEEMSLAEGLNELRLTFLTYVVTFIILGQYWVAHHNQTLFIQRSDQVLLWLNIFFLMGVAAVPFSAKVLGRYSEDMLAVIVYSGNLSYVSLTHYLVFYYAMGKNRQGERRLVSNDLDASLTGLARNLSLGPIVFYAVAIPAHLIHPLASDLIYVSVPVWVVISLIRSLPHNTADSPPPT